MSLTYESSSETYGKDEILYIKVRINKPEFQKTFTQTIKHFESHITNAEK